MYVLIVEAKVKRGMRERFVEAIVDDAVHSEADEPGCLRFDVVQDIGDPDTFWFYEVYLDADAVAAHAETPHFLRFAAAIPELIDGDLVRRDATSVHPAPSAWR
jgi:autoinducer 2-degrading protein